LRIKAEYKEHLCPIFYRADWIASAVNLHVTGLQLGGFDLQHMAWTISNQYLVSPNSEQQTSTVGTNTACLTNSCQNDWIAKSMNQNTGLQIEAEYEEHSFPISYHTDWIACAVNLHVTGLQLGR
jgi:hypothetical protein